VLNRILNMFRVPDLRHKILFTMAMILLYRFGAYVPAPGIDLNQVQQLRHQAQQGGALAYINLFSGGALTQMAVFALGVMPYITSSIIMQVLAVVIPKLEQWQEQGAVGQRKITQWTRYLTVAIALLQSTGFAFLFHNGGGGFFAQQTKIDLLPVFTPVRIALVVATLTAGTALLMWIGELITLRGIGNGMSILIMVSVVSRYPGQFNSIRVTAGQGAFIATLLLYAALTVAIVFVEQGQRRIPVQFAKRVVGRRMYGGNSTYIPLKVNQAGVIPIIFASSVLYLPQLLSALLPTDHNPNNTTWGESVQSFVSHHLARSDDFIYLTVFGLLIIGFTFFYTQITFDPVKQADSIRKQGGFIPGIRPGPQTERYLGKILSRITVPGAFFIAAVALIPPIALGLILPPGADQFSFAFAGTSILIAVGVSLETMKQIDSQLMMRNYEGFLR
jgi:preprotein translocase subunit SecY